MSGRPRGTARLATLGRVTAGQKFNRTAVIVDQSDMNIPRDKRRRQLHELGLVVDFWTNWNQSDIYHAIEAAFQGTIDTDKPYPRWVVSACKNIKWEVCATYDFLLLSSISSS